MLNLQQDYKTQLREASLQITEARIETLRIFESHETPFDAQHLIEHLKKNLGVDRVTVFRILNTFSEKGLIRKLEFGEGKARYELNRGEHHHLICEQCGNIEDISDCNISALELEIKKRKKFLVKSHSLEFFGLCSNCQK